MTTENPVIEQLETSENNGIGAKLPPSREENPLVESGNSSAKTTENYIFKGGNAYVGHSLALKLTGSSPATLHRYTTNGKLSYEKDENGHKIYQVAELERVFRKLKTLETNDNVSIEEEREQLETPFPDPETALKVALLEEKLRHAEEMKLIYQQQAERAQQEANQWREQADAVARMLTYQPQPQPQPQATAPTTTPEPEQPAAPPKKKFLGIFGGR